MKGQSNSQLTSKVIKSGQFELKSGHFDSKRGQFDLQSEIIMYINILTTNVTMN